MTSWVKYPRTLHVPSSPGATSDDKRMHDLSVLLGQTVVITEKMDGENTTLYADGYHARSLDSGYHPARARLAALHAQIAHRIPAGWRICGENVYARHSVTYTALPSHFLAFSIWDATDHCLSWDDTQAQLTSIGLRHVPVLWRGVLDHKALADVTDAIDTQHQEGFVIRLAGAFPFIDFRTSVAKWVRAGHVNSATHWRHQEIVPNSFVEEDLSS